MYVCMYVYRYVPAISLKPGVWIKQWSACFLMPVWIQHSALSSIYRCNSTFLGSNLPHQPASCCCWVTVFMSPTPDDDDGLHFHWCTMRLLLHGKNLDRTKPMQTGAYTIRSLRPRTFLVETISIRMLRKDSSWKRRRLEKMNRSIRPSLFR